MSYKLSTLILSLAKELAKEYRDKLLGKEVGGKMIETNIKPVDPEFSAKTVMKIYGDRISCREGVHDEFSIYRGKKYHHCILRRSIMGTPVYYGLVYEHEERKLCLSNGEDPCEYFYMIMIIDKGTSTRIYVEPFFLLYYDVDTLVKFLYSVFGDVDRDLLSRILEL